MTNFVGPEEEKESERAVNGVPPLAPAIVNPQVRRCPSENTRHVPTWRASSPGRSGSNR